MKNNGEFSHAQIGEMAIFAKRDAEQIRDRSANEIMDEIRGLGYIPARRLNQAIRRKWDNVVQQGVVTPEQVEEPEKLTSSHMQAIAESMEPPPEICQPPDPLDPFADEATNRLEQDLLMASNGIRPRAVKRRRGHYEKYFNEPALQGKDLVQKYRRSSDSCNSDLHRMRLLCAW